MADIVKETAGNVKNIGKGTMGGATAVAASAGKQGMGAIGELSDKGLNLAEGTLDKSMKMLDSAVPPEQREALTNSIKKWAGDNPALAIFALPQVVLTALPLFLFWLFTALILVLSLVLALLIALLITVIFIVFMLLIAVFVVLPVMFAAAFAGIFLSLWGLMIYKFVFPKLQLKEKAGAAKKKGQKLGVIGGDAPKKRRAKSTVATEDGKKMDLPNVPRGDPTNKFQAGPQKRKVKKKKKLAEGVENGSAQANGGGPAPEKTTPTQGKKQPTQGKNEPAQGQKDKVPGKKVPAQEKAPAQSRKDPVPAT